MIKVRIARPNKWEYKTTSCNFTDDLDMHMNDMGKQGWRVIQGPNESFTAKYYIIRWERPIDRYA